MTSHVAIWPRPHPEQIERLHTKGSHVHEQINWTGCLREIFAFHIEVKFSLNGRLHVLSCPCLMPLQRIWTSKSWHFSGQLKVMRRLQARLPKLRSSSLHNSSLPDESPPPHPSNPAATTQSPWLSPQGRKWNLSLVHYQIEQNEEGRVPQADTVKRAWNRKLDFGTAFDFS